ncbi:MAG TPA: acyl-CoA thioesterase, partial [Gemmatimonadaceae bacterium]|nr:acyl-CoA thioesterase [Gemmatimonadaceae bacterium]
EIYTVDVDRSYGDALIVGQRLYRRDLITGDSALLFEDTTVAGIAAWYAREHPDDRPLRPDEELPAEPHVSAVGELSIVEHLGPYLSVEYRMDAAIADSEDWQSVRRQVIDARRGSPLTVREVAGDTAGKRVLAQGTELFRQALDSVLASRDSRARVAATALSDFIFDSASFTITTVDGSAAVAFVAPGQGERAGGLTLELPPIRIPSPSWWPHMLPSLARAVGDSGIDRWAHRGYQVIARYSTEGRDARVWITDSAGRDWTVRRVPAPAWRIFWLDAPDVTSEQLRAVARAFDEAALYNEETRTAMSDLTTRSISGERRPRRAVRESQHEASELMMPQHANNLGHVFGGVILSMMDRTAAVAAIRHARQNCVTVSVDRVDFREPIHLGDLVVMKASVNYAGRSSMEVGVRVEAENLVAGGRRHTNSCYLTFVAIDRDGRPVEVPELIPETEVEHRRYQAAQERRRRRLEEREAEGRAVRG